MHTKTAATKIFVRFSSFFVLALLVALAPSPVVALGSPEPTQSQSFGLEGTIDAPSPKTAATISTPTSGQTFTDTPITVAGLCTSGLLVRVFANNVFVGSTMCQNGSYRLQVDLFSGRNELVVRVYDALDQAGPDSSAVSVTFNDAQFAEFGSRVSLISLYARRGASPGIELVWPLVLAGGNGPYAVSVDWGDGSPDTLVSRALAGSFDLSHSYEEAGIYAVIVKATDTNGMAAYLQLVAVANGQASTVGGTSAGGASTIIKDTAFGRYGWTIALAAVPLLAVTFWLGQRHELFVIRKRIDDGRRQAGA